MSNKDTIYRQDAIDTLLKWMWPICINNEEIIESDDMVAVRNILKSLPPAQPEQKIGKFIRWMEKRETPKHISYTPHCKCSLCGNELLIENINYCYMCGARLIEDRDAERREDDTQSGVN